MDIKKTNKKILLVEDDKVFAKLVKRWITNITSWEVSVVHDGIIGTDVANSQPWDLIISDVNIPRLNGFDLVRFCKNNVPNVPVLLITAQESVDYAIKALRTKADDLLIKPFSRTDIIGKAIHLMEQASKTIKANNVSVLAIGAHPDDVEIGCGGLLSQHAQKGDQVNILTLCNGNVGGEESLRKIESENAAKHLNANLYFGGLLDTKIQDGQETISVIEQIINQTNPSIIYTHTKNDSHQDHRNTHLATIVAARKVSSIYCYQSPSTNIDFRPTLFTDIGGFMEKKLRLISEYKTQTQKCSYLDESLISSTAKYWGRFADYKMVEPFEVIRESK